MKVVIITEGSSEIGFGHITRCMSLYHIFKEKGFTVQFIVNGDFTVEPLLKNTNYETFNWLENKDKLFKLLKNTAIVIIDSYLSNEALYKEIAGYGLVSVYIDDNNRIDYPKGIVVNGSIHAEKINYSSSNEIDYLLGSQFIPLRQQFWNISEKKVRTSLENVMVTFGGDDLRNLTPKILKILKDNYPSLNKKIIIGNGFKDISDIENLKDERTEFIYYPDANGMLDAMLESDIAISAGGQTLYELARVGVPTIAIAVSQNQIHNVENWQKVGFIKFAGQWNDEKLFKNVLNKLELLKDDNIRLKMGNIGKMSVDGKGALRIANYSLNRYYVNKVRLRPANYHDIYDVFELSNDDIVRQNSFNSSRIKLEDHGRWFKSKIEDPATVFLIINLGNNFAGQIRFDLDDDSATVNISIKKEFRGLDLGKNFLENAITYLKSNSPQVRIIKAYIKENNKKSINLFEKLDFKYEQNVSIKNQNALEYILPSWGLKNGF